MVCTVLEQTAPAMKKQFSKHVPAWPGKSVEEVVCLATFVCSDGDEERVKAKRPQRKEEVSVFGAVLREGFGESGGRGRGRARGGGWNQSDREVRLGE